MPSTLRGSMRSPGRVPPAKVRASMPTSAVPCSRPKHLPLTIARAMLLIPLMWLLPHRLSHHCHRCLALLQPCLREAALLPAVRMAKPSCPLPSQLLFSRCFPCVGVDVRCALPRERAHTRAHKHTHTQTQPNAQMQQGNNVFDGSHRLVAAGQRVRWWRDIAQCPKIIFRLKA
eukprot:4279487-Amphidinium_carterae.1